MLSILSFLSCCTTTVYTHTHSRTTRGGDTLYTFLPCRVFMSCCCWVSMVGDDVRPTLYGFYTATASSLCFKREEEDVLLLVFSRQPPCRRRRSTALLYLTNHKEFIVVLRSTFNSSIYSMRFTSTLEMTLRSVRI